YGCITDLYIEVGHECIGYWPLSSFFGLVEDLWSFKMHGILSNIKWDSVQGRSPYTIDYHTGTMYFMDCTRSLETPGLEMIPDDTIWETICIPIQTLAIS